MISAARCGTTKKMDFEIYNEDRKTCLARIGKYTGEKKNLIIKTTFLQKFVI